LASAKSVTISAILLARPAIDRSVVKSRKWANLQEDPGGHDGKAFALWPVLVNVRTQWRGGGPDRVFFILTLRNRLFQAGNPSGCGRFAGQEFPLLDLDCWNRAKRELLRRTRLSCGRNSDPAADPLGPRLAEEAAVSKSRGCPQIKGCWFMNSVSSTP